MLDLTVMGKIKSPCKKMPNILRPDVPGLANKGKRLFIAPMEICTWAQNIINRIPEHRHLKEATVMLLISTSPGVAKKLRNGEIVTVGKAAKAGDKEKMLSMMGSKDASPDFIITLSGDWLRTAGILDDDLKVRDCDLATASRGMSLVDHELLHCGANIAGQFIAPDLQDEFIKQLGGRHIETCKDVLADDGSGDELVRYYQIKDKKYIWKMRKHDIQEFFGVVDRWGKSNRQVGKLVDVVKKNEKTLFGTAA